MRKNSTGASYAIATAILIALGITIPALANFSKEDPRESAALSIRPNPETYLPNPLIIQQDGGIRFCAPTAGMRIFTAEPPVNVPIKAP
ncbi:MAG: hypothetical protein LBG65_05190 [Puniceicoccales bacterium]|jgi:hypothetical protein|nr:hypothetical protein [Puniceicoccales bacterium]